jgi:hypothetical protein
MKHRNLDKIIAQLKIGKPPRKLDILVEISNIQWDEFTEYDIDKYCEILLELNAESITVIFSNDKIKKEYLEIFDKVYENIISSNIINISEEIHEYFQKYSQYISEIRSSL